MKKILRIVLSLLVVFGMTACGGGNKLEEIAKNINNSETVKNYKEYGYEVEATTTGDTLTVTSKVDEETKAVEFKLDGNVLGNEKLTALDLMAALLVVNAVGQTQGYKDGEVSQNMNAFPAEYEKYTLENEGLELIMDNDDVSLKIDLSKKVPLIDMNTFYLKAEDFDMISQFIAEKEHGNQSGKNGNIAYDVFLGEDESTIQIGQDEKLADSAYKSILSALEVMYGEDTAKHFQELYPEFVDGKTEAEAFTIEKGYQPEDQNESVFKDTEVVLVTINNKKVK